MLNIFNSLVVFFFRFDVMLLLQNDNYFFFGKKPKMMSVTTILTLCFAVGCCSTVIQPCGPRMCEQITRMSGATTSTYDSYSLSCTLTGVPAKVG